jgi:acyl carrier protein
MHPSEQQSIERLRAFVFENFLYMRPDFELADDDHLLERGVVDSLGVVEMVQFVEQEFGVEVAEDEISEANLGSLQAIARFISGKQAAVLS